MPTESSVSPEVSSSPPKKSFVDLDKFWTPILAVFLVSAIGIFLSGKNIVTYSILICSTFLILIYSWRQGTIPSDDNWLPKIYKFIVATIPQSITMIQLALMIALFSHFKEIIENQKIPDIFKSFNTGLFVIFLGQIGLIFWYLQQKISKTNSWLVNNFLPIFVTIATISSAVMLELWTIIRFFITDG